MNCLEFRRLKLSDPRHLAADATAHARACATCAAFAMRIDAQDARLARILSVSPPDGLADRVMLGVQRRRFPRRVAALAAAVLLSLGAGASVWHEGARHDHARFAVEHVLHEPEALTQHRLADPAYFAEVMSAFGAELSEPLGRVRFMKVCPVPEGTGWHIVVDTPHGLVTLMLIPGHRPRAAPVRTAISGWRVSIRPAGQGYYALVSDSPEVLERVESLFRRAVRWRS